jgi:alpha-ribazole phosphatase
LTRLLLVRHGQTGWNAERRFQGQSDRPLNPRGRWQAEWLRQRLAAEALEAIYASDLQRAWDTAEAIAEPHDLAVRSEPRLREMHFGQWEGLTYAEIRKQDRQALDSWEADPLSVAPPGGESVGQLAARVQAALDGIVGAHADGTVLLVAHGGALQVLLCLAFGLSPHRYWQFRLDPAGLSELYIYTVGPILTLLNDTHHLPSDREDSGWEN